MGVRGVDVQIRSIIMVALGHCVLHIPVSVLALCSGVSHMTIPGAGQSKTVRTAAYFASTLAELKHDWYQFAHGEPGAKNAGDVTAEVACATTKRLIGAVGAPYRANSPPVCGTQKSVLTTVLSTTRFPEAVVPDEYSAYCRMLNSGANFAESFAELRAIGTPNPPLCPCLLR